MQGDSVYDLQRIPLPVYGMVARQQVTLKVGLSMMSWANGGVTLWAPSGGNDG